MSATRRLRTHADSSRLHLLVEERAKQEGERIGVEELVGVGIAGDREGPCLKRIGD